MNRLPFAIKAACISLLFTFGLLAASPASAADGETAVSPAILKLMERAAARGDGSLSTVVELAIEADPEQEAAIRAAASALTADPAPDPVEAPPVATAAVMDLVQETDAQAEEEPRKPTTLWSFRGWDGEVEFSANRSTGNTRQTGLGLGAAAAKKVGRWKHEGRTLIEFEEDDGETTKQRFLVGYDLNYTFSERTYVFGHLLYEDDRFGGYDYRFSETVGLGYKIIDHEVYGWSVEGGPGARHTNEEVGGLNTELVGVLGSKAFWDINERSRLTHNYTMFIGSDRTTIDTTAALKLQINGALSARLSYNYRYDSDVPPDTRKTDTVTKAAIVYDF